EPRAGRSRVAQITETPHGHEHGVLHDVIDRGIPTQHPDRDGSHHGTMPLKQCAEARGVATASGSDQLGVRAYKLLIGRCHVALTPSDKESWLGSELFARSPHPPCKTYHQTCVPISSQQINGSGRRSTSLNGRVPCDMTPPRTSE